MSEIKNQTMGSYVKGYCTGGVESIQTTGPYIKEMQFEGYEVLRFQYFGRFVRVHLKGYESGPHGWVPRRFRKWTTRARFAVEYVPVWGNHASE
jgi:hypothetical protein